MPRRRRTRNDSVCRRLLVTPPGQIARTLRAAALGVPAAGSHGEAIARAIGMLLSLTGDSHFAFEDQQPRVEFMGMLGICRVRLHPAIDDLMIALRTTLGLELRPVHWLSPEKCC